MMDITIREIRDEDMVEISGWLSDQPWPYPSSQGIMPPHALVAEKNGGLLCAVYLYTTDSTVCFVDWLSYDAKADMNEVAYAFNQLFKTVERVALKLTPQIKVLTLTTKSHKIADFLERSGFRVKNSFFKATKLLGDSSHANTSG